jgi:uncharacterized membrane protein
MRKLILASIVLIVLLFLVNIYAYTILPETIVTHWNDSGQPNGTMGKFWGLFLVPIITLFAFLLFLLIPFIDPLKNNIEKFRKYYESFIFVFTLFMFYVNAITILWNLGTKLNINLSLMPALGLLFIYLGILLKNVKRNWLIGIRTPWTLSSEKVWDKTHKLGSKLFIISGIITFLGLFFPGQIILFVLVPIILSSIWLIIYSYLMYRKEKKK